MKEEKDLFRVFDKLTEKRERCFDVKELRIGSHAMFNGLRNRVVGIEIKDDENAPIIIKTLERIENKTIDMALEPDEIDPIPITDELLKELGFEECVGIFRIFLTMLLENFRLVIEEADKGIYQIVIMNTDRQVVSCCKYLHQLENFIYMATGKELVKD